MVLQSKIKSNAANIIGSSFIGNSFMMGFQNYVRMTEAINLQLMISLFFLKSLPKNDIIFIYGDNDTYPVWGFRRRKDSGMM
jgi:hypothetical protein